MAVCATQIVNSVHLHGSKLARSKATFMPVFDFWRSLATAVVGFFQMAAFAYEGPPPPEVFKPAQDYLAVSAYWLFSGSDVLNHR